MDAAESTALLARHGPPAELTMRAAFDRGITVTRAKRGTFMLSRHDTLVSATMLQLGEWEDAVVADLVRLLGAGDVAYDVGAHMGTVTLPLATAVGSAGRVVAFEPQAHMANLIRGTAALNGVDWVDVVAAGVTDAATAEHGSITITSPSFHAPANFAALGLTAGNDFMRLAATGTDSTRQVPMVTLDDLWLHARTVAEREEGRGDGAAGSGAASGGDSSSHGPPIALVPAQCPAAIKVDAEGMDAAVLSGAHRILRECRPSLVVEANCEADAASVFAVLRRHKYACAWHLSMVRPDDNFAGVDIVGGASASEAMPRDGPSSTADARGGQCLTSHNVLCVAQEREEQLRADGRLVPWLAPRDAGTARGAVHDGDGETDDDSDRKDSDEPSHDAQGGSSVASATHTRPHVRSAVVPLRVLWDHANVADDEVYDWDALGASLRQQSAAADVECIKASARRGQCLKNGIRVG